MSLGGCCYRYARRRTEPEANSREPDGDNGVSPFTGGLDQSLNVAGHCACPDGGITSAQTMIADKHVQSSQSRSIGRLNGSIAADSASASVCRFSSSVSWISCRCS
jgi:hypothetical protein